MIPCIVSPPSDTVTCVDSERNTEVISFTLPYSVCSRDAAIVVAPVVGMIASNGL